MTRLRVLRDLTAIGCARAGQGEAAIPVSNQCAACVRAIVVATMMVVLSAPAVWAQTKTDVVTLINGDRITGEIKNLSRGRLEFSTDDAGTLEIEWDKITQLVATRLFEIETSDGRLLLGSLGQASTRILVVVSSDGSVSLTMAEVTRITPIGARFWSKFDGSVDSGFSYTRSSGLAQFTLNSDTVFRRPAFLLRLTTSVTLTHLTDEDSRDDRGTLSLSYIRYRGRWLVGGIGSLETNESLGLILRSQAVGMVGQRLVNTNRAQFEAGAGLGVNEEQGVDTEATSNVEAVFAVTTSYYTYDRPKTSFDASVQYYPSLSQWGRQRVQFDGSIRRELLKDFTVSLNVYDTYDSDPPNPDAEINDVGVVVSAGWTF